MDYTPPVTERTTGYDHRVPKYLAIYRALAAEIADGTHQPGAALPPQRQLADRFAVTLMTVRQALRALQDDGLVEARPGTGTFVRQPGFAYHLAGLRSLSEELTAQGLELRTTVLATELVTAPEEVAARLGLAPGQRVLAVERLRSASPEPDAPVVPLLLQTSYLAERWSGRLEVDELREHSLYRLLGRAGRPVVSAQERLQAVALTAREAELLDRPAGSPALLSRRLSRDAAGEPLVDDRAIMVGDGTVVVADRAATDVSLTYRTQNSPG